MTARIRARIVELDAPDIEVVDDGHEFVFTAAWAGGSGVTLRWRVDDVELAQLVDGLNAEPREAWGTPTADGVYVILNLIEELVRISPRGHGRIIVDGSTLVLAPDQL